MIFIQTLYLLSLHYYASLVFSKLPLHFLEKMNPWERLPAGPFSLNPPVNWRCIRSSCILARVSQPLTDSAARKGSRGELRCDVNEWSPQIETDSRNSEFETSQLERSKIVIRKREASFVSTRGRGSGTELPPPVTSWLLCRSVPAFCQRENRWIPLTTLDFDRFQSRRSVLPDFLN